MRVVFRAEDNHLLQGLAAEGMGAAIMPLLAIDRSRDDIVAVALNDLIPPRRIGLIWHRDWFRTPAALAFVELARETAADLVARLPAGAQALPDERPA